ncbi:TIR domain-containing protein [Legionella pneumophila]
MVTKKTIFVAFAIEDERSRDFLKGQSLKVNCPFEYIDMSVKEAYETDWKNKVRARIRRSDGVIALISKNSLYSSGQKWEIACAKEERKKILGIWAYTDDRTNLEGMGTVVWAWDTIKNFIDSL